MGIGRREFLKFVATALGGIVIDPLTPFIVNGDYYVNTTLGLGFIKPSAWKFDLFKDFASILEGQIFQGIEDDAEDEVRRDQASTLVATISKYGDDVARFSPSITVFKNREDREMLESQNIELLVWDAIDGFSTLLKEYAVIEEPVPRTISNCPAIRFKSRWLFEHRKIEPIIIEDEALAIDQGSVLYTIHLYDSPETGDSAPSEFRQFVRSVHIA
jgi:hypothetical protein